MNNSLFKKGLLSAAAASVLVSGVYATMTVNTPSAKTMFSGSLGTTGGTNGDNYLTVNDINLTEVLSTIGTTAEYLTITIPSSAQLALVPTAGQNATTLDLNTSNITSNGFLYVMTANNLQGTFQDGNNSLWIDINGSGNEFTGGRYKLLDLNTSRTNGSTFGSVLFARDSQTSGVFILNTLGGEINATGALTNATPDVTGLPQGTAFMDANRTKVGTVSKDSSGNVSLVLTVRGTASLGDSAQIAGLKLKPATTTTSGDVNLVIAGTSAFLPSATVKAATFKSTVAQFDMNTSSIPNLIVGTTPQSFADFNITVPGGTANKDGNISISLSNAKFGAASAVAVTQMTSGGVTKTVYAGADANTTSGIDGNTTLVIYTNQMKMVNTSSPLRLNIQGTIIPTGAAGSAITASFSTATTGLRSDGNFSSLQSNSISAVTIGNIIADGVTIAPADGNASGYTGKTLVVGKSSQAVIDVNVSENSLTSFSSTNGANTIAFSLPTGYVFASDPNVSFYDAASVSGTLVPTTQTGCLNKTLSPSIVGGSTYTISFADAACSAAFWDANSSLRQMMTIQGIKVTVPATAKDGDVIALSISTGTGSIFTSSKNPNVTSINVGTVRATAAALTERNTTTQTVSTTTDIGDSSVAFDVNESYAGVMTAGSTITVTLPSPLYFANTGTGGITNTTGGLVVNTSFSGSTDGNRTATYTIATSASTAKGQFTIALPAIKGSGITTPTTTAPVATIGGTAGVTYGSGVKLANFVYGTNLSTKNLVAITTNTPSATTGELILTENIVQGLANTSGAAFKVIAPTGVTFPTAGGNYYIATMTGNSATSAGTLGTYDGGNNVGAVSTTFNTNDTLNIPVPSTISTANLDMYGFKVKVNVGSSVAAGNLLFSVADVNGSGVRTQTGIALAVIGSSLPTVTAAPAATIAAGATGSVIPTGAIGTVTYAVTTDNANGKITVSSAGVVTVDANATAGNTATITATDSGTGTAVTTVITVGAAAAAAATGTLSLAAGWNLVTVPANTSMAASALNAVAATSASSGNKLVWVFNASAATYASTGAGAYTGNIVAGQGAWVKVTAATSVPVTGTVNSSAFSLTNTVSALATGWNVAGNSGSSASTLTGVKHAWGYMGDTTGWVNYMSTAPSDAPTYAPAANIPTGTALWIEK